RLGLERPLALAPPRDRLPPVLPAALPGGDEASGARGGGGAAGAAEARARRGSHRSRAGAERAAPRDRRLPAPLAAGRGLSRRGAPGRAPRRTADRLRLEPGGSRPRREAARDQMRLSRSELGQPDEQGSPARPARPRARLERAPEGGGGRPPPGSGR